MYMHICICVCLLLQFALFSQKLLYGRLEPTLSPDLYIHVYIYIHTCIRVGRTMTNFSRGSPRRISGICPGTGSKH